MHRTGDFFRRRLPLRGLLPSLIGAWAAAVTAAPVPSLYAAIVPDADPQRSAQLAMREVLVRLVGSRDAADDPALAAIVDDAKRYVQLERNTTRGATQVIFDSGALRAAVVAAGRSVWDPDRPLVWVVLPQASGAAGDELRAQLNSAAQLRGLPIALVSSDSSGVAADGGIASSAVVLAAARRAGAGAALLAQSSAGGDPQMLQWTLVAPNTEGHWAGSAALAIDGVTDALVRSAHELESAPPTQLDCRIDGVADLPAFTAVLGSVSSAPGVGEVTLLAIAADRVTLHVRSRGGGAALTRALAADRIRASGAAADGTLQYHYQAGP
jgi:uncharacterized protein DUF2066